MTNKQTKVLIGFFIWILALVTYKIAVAQDVILCEHYIKIQDYAKCRVTETWNESEWQAFDILIRKESNWNSEAQNPISSAFGLGQFVSSTWATVGCVKTNDPREQIECTLKYISKNYKTPANSLRIHNEKGWY